MNKHMFGYRMERLLVLPNFHLILNRARWSPLAASQCLLLLIVETLLAPGAEWAKDIDAHLDSASIILLLISFDFLASDSCYSVEMQGALERHNRGEARVIPIFLRPVDWKQAPFAHLQGLPRDGKAVTLWNNQDEAFADIVHQLRRVLDPTRTLVLSPAEKANRAFLLKGVRRQWIEGILLNSLHHEVLIQLGLHEYPSTTVVDEERRKVIQGKSFFMLRRNNPDLLSSS